MYDKIHYNIKKKKKVNDLGLFVYISLTVNLKAKLKCLFFLPSSEEIAEHLLCDSHSFQLTIQITYYFFFATDVL